MTDRELARAVSTMKVEYLCWQQAVAEAGNPDWWQCIQLASEYILGISAFYHDSAACLLSGDTIVAAAQEERFTRVKGDERFRTRQIMETGMTRRILLPTVMLLVSGATLAAHDLFLRADSYFVAPGGTVRLQVLNGTFSKSENAVTKDRLRELTIVTSDGVTKPLDVAGWAETGDTSIVTAAVGESGTYVIGASLRPREIALEAKDFNAYLASDGLPDVLAERRRTKELALPARERYSKHVKALVQVGSSRTSGYGAELGYPAELVPLDNPYSLRPGGTLRVRAVVEGSPVANQVVIAGGRTSGGGRIAPRSVRTNRDGVARIPVNTRGVWYVKFISMQRAAADTSIDYESKWATLTFGVR